jgi:hypothetical protein
MGARRIFLFYLPPSNAWGFVADLPIVTEV